MRQATDQRDAQTNCFPNTAPATKNYSWVILVSNETSSTMRGATDLQLHQILRLPRKINLMIDPPLRWNVIYNARSKKSHPPTSPNTAPATNFWVQDISGKSLNCFRQYNDDSSTIRGYPRIKSSSRTRRFGDLTRRISETFCMEKYNIWRSGYLPKFHEMLRLPGKVTLQVHQILHLPRKKTLMIDPQLFSTWLLSTRVYSTLLYSTLRYTTLLYSISVPY